MKSLLNVQYHQPLKEDGEAGRNAKKRCFFRNQIFPIAKRQKRENCIGGETSIGWHTVTAIILNNTLVYLKTKQTTLSMHAYSGDTNRPYQVFDKIGYYYNNILGNGSQRKLIKIIME